MNLALLCGCLNLERVGGECGILVQKEELVLKRTVICLDAKIMTPKL